MVVDKPLSEPNVTLEGRNMLKILSSNSRYCSIHFLPGKGIMGSILILTSKPASKSNLAALILESGSAVPFSHFLDTFGVLTLKLTMIFSILRIFNSSSILSDLVTNRTLCPIPVSYTHLTLPTKA